MVAYHAQKMLTTLERNISTRCYGKGIACAAGPKDTSSALATMAAFQIEVKSENACVLRFRHTSKTPR